MKNKDVRYYDIDAARTFVMFVAVFIHGSNVYSPHDPMRTANTERFYIFDWFSSALHMFISPTFFIVGGFFSIFLLERYGLKKFVLKRFSRVGIPMVFALLTVNVLEHFLRYRDHFAPRDGALDFWAYLSSDHLAKVFAQGEWLHIWFLVQLALSFLVVITGCAIFQQLKLKGDFFLKILDRLVRIATFGPVPVLTLILCLTGLQFAAITLSTLLPAPYSPFQVAGIGIISPYNFAFYFVYFLAGLCLYWNNRLYETVFKWEIWMVPLALVSLALQIKPEFFELPTALENAVFGLHLALKWITILTTLKLFHHYFRDKPSKTLLHMSDATMTVYVFHHVFVYLLGDFFVSIHWPVFIEWAIIVTASVSAAMAIHLFLVKPSTIMRFIINGQTGTPRSIAKPKPVLKETGAS
ncbi:acyltransferase family protein [Aestuariispira insulae]|uniref:Acyltransferase-like protein n=1 Tax=Aestuariispira insulae TaxID=1461337 RepID=A0A3D9HTP5_9PROT|nr:acyltransferase family protein [Aestuariispira insulae]RED52246.1 acyltransferase-like protein [Aestuariispira insulae]